MAVGKTEVVIVDINAQSSVEATIPMLAPLRGPAFIGHASPQVSEAHGGGLVFVDMDESTVVVNVVATQPLTMTVVKGEQVVVGIVEPLALTEVATHCTVTCNAVLVDMHDADDTDDDDDGDNDDDDNDGNEVPTDEAEFELLLESSLSFVSLSFSDVKSSKDLSIESTSFMLILSVMLSRL